MPEQATFICWHCRTTIGIFETIANNRVLVVNGIMVYSFHGRCIKCNSEIHWHASDDKLRSLVEYVRNLEAELEKSR